MVPVVVALFLFLRHPLLFLFQVSINIRTCTNVNLLNFHCVHVRVHVCAEQMPSSPASPPPGNQLTNINGHGHSSADQKFRECNWKQITKPKHLRGPPQSKLWNPLYFKVYDKAHNYEGVAICQLCVMHTELRTGLGRNSSTSGIERHLFWKHYEDWQRHLLTPCTSLKQFR
jgi:hypothetical protein